MATENGDSLRRLPFARGDADAVVAFCKAHGGSDEARLLLDLTSDPAGVISIGGGDGPTLVMTVIDRIRNGADAAILETLAVRAPLAAASFLRLVVEPAIGFTRAGPHRVLHVVLQPGMPPAEGAEAALRERGFAHVYDTFDMCRPAALPPPETPAPLPAGWSWTDLDAGRADAAHAALVEIFHEALGTSVMPLAAFRQVVASGEAVWRVLLDGARGKIRIVGRAPAYRRRGIGTRLLAEGLRLLRARGAGDVDLSVEAENERALELYRRFGFEVLTRTPVFGLTLR